MDKNQAKKRIKKLTKEISKYDSYYYAKNNPLISDMEYDQLRKELDRLESEYPQYILSESPNLRIGTPIAQDIKATVTHKIPMFSINNVWDTESVFDFDSTRKKLLNVTSINYICEPKYDGLSCALLYENGVLKRGSTRGDGYEGEDVSKNVKVINDIPLNLKDTNPPKLVEIRGEVVLFKDDFKKLNKRQESNGKSLFANPRNAASGSLRQLDPKITASRKLHFFGWGMGLHKGWEPKTQNELLNKLTNWGFTVDSHHKVCATIEQAILFYDKTGKIRDEFPFEIDGIVIKVNNYAFQEKLGNTAHAPRWSIAYKFEAKQVTTKLKDIVTQVGRTGVITPIAILEPVKLGGVFITKASLHTFDLLDKKDLRIGDKVLIERAGDVIPEVISPIVSIRTGKESIFKRPENCPSCGHELTKSGAYWICKNIRCPAQLLAKMVFLTSRKAFNIKGFGESSIELMIKHELIKDLADIFYLTKENLTKLPKWGVKKTENLMSEINFRKHITLSKFINSLSIQGVGLTTAQILAKQFQNLESLKAADKETLIQIPSIGPNVADAFIDFFKDDYNLKIIKKMIDAGVTIKNESYE